MCRICKIIKCASDAKHEEYAKCARAKFANYEKPNIRNQTYQTKQKPNLTKFKVFIQTFQIKPAKPNQTKHSQP